ncbi:FHA domain-containing protein, partial [Candidatus Magnetoovum chiemensis]
MAKVLLKFKDAVMKEYTLDKEVTSIGRKAANDIHVDNLAVSSSHARIFKKGEQFYVEDLSSLNGTFVNGKKIQVHPLSNGDAIVIGKHSLVFQSDTPGAAKQAASKEKDMMDETILIDVKLKDEFLAGKQQLAAAQTKKADMI